MCLKQGYRLIKLTYIAICTLIRNTHAGTYTYIHMYVPDYGFRLKQDQGRRKQVLNNS